MRNMDVIGTRNCRKYNINDYKDQGKSAKMILDQKETEPNYLILRSVIQFFTVHPSPDVCNRYFCHLSSFC